MIVTPKEMINVKQGAKRIGQQETMLHQQTVKQKWAEGLKMLCNDAVIEAGRFALSFSQADVLRQDVGKQAKPRAWPPRALAKAGMKHAISPDECSFLCQLGPAFPPDLADGRIIARSA